MDEQIEYNAHEDFRFPVGLLYKAYSILENHGYSSFRKYTSRINMPMQDVEGVLNKFQYNTDPKFKAKIDKILAHIRKAGVEIRL